MKWEYRIRVFKPRPNGNIHVDGSDQSETTLTPFLLAEGSDGWELVQLWTNPATSKTEAVFKRPGKE